MIKKLCFYGSLRSGQYNHSRIKQLYPGEMKYISSARLVGYLMYSLYHYPAVCKTGKDTDKILVEYYEVSENVYNHVRDMELGAGYHEDIVGDYIIYLIDQENIIDNDIVKGGDWVNYKKVIK